MTTTIPTALEGVLAGLMRRYIERVPDVATITHAMVADGLIPNAAAIENDHIAFRTMGVPQLGIRSFERIFLHYGYQRRDRYDFAAKKLNAYWYSPPAPIYPRIFVSELRVADLSSQAQRIITSYTDEVRGDPVDRLDLNDAAAVDAFLHQPLWRLPSVEDYQRLLEESEYAAWVIYNRYYLNHYTVSVHNLPDGYATLEEFNAFLERHGITLNNSGGKIKVSPDGLLRQSSTVAEVVEALFAGGATLPIAGSYVEFAERRVLPEYAHLPRHAITRAQRREGFESGNADKIFESTFTEQISQRAT
ncbi:MAG: DUF1338 domain-containing protein [Roseiflexaceae bacterium]